jgi:hypothetical protein
VLQAISPERRAELQQAMVETYGAGGEQRAPQEAHNARAVRFLGLMRLYDFRGRTFLVPPIGFDDGCELQELQVGLAAWSLLVSQTAEALHALADQADSPELRGRMEALLQEHAQRLREHHNRLVRAVTLFHGLVRPLRRWDKLTWRWRGNPFANMSEREVAQGIDFFSRCRMT